MNGNNKKIFIIIISLALVVITGTFAWLSWRSQNTAMVLTIGDIRGLTVTLQPYQINQTLSPVSSYVDGVVIDVTTANAKNEADDFKLYYKIDTIDSALIDSGFKYTITKCTANCDNSNNYSVLSNAGGSFASASSNSNLSIYNETIPANTTYKYKVYLWIDSSGGNQSNMQNKIFTGELRASVTSAIYGMMRDNGVIDNTKSKYVSSTSGIDFNAVSSNTNGKGIYMRAGTESDSYPIYYYRGAVDNNNVLFAGFCWKIVRTTSTGGTKLIYNGLPSGTNNNECNNTGTATQLTSTSGFSNYNTSIADVGYMYGTRYTYQTKAMTGITSTYMYSTNYDDVNHKLVNDNTISFAGTDWGTYYNQLNNNHYTCFNTSGECNQVYYIYNTNNTNAYYVQIPSGKTISGMLDEMLTSSSNTNSSNIKTVLDNWYRNNLIDYADMLEDTPWCNKRSIYSLAGWNPSGGSITAGLSFSGIFGISLTCPTNDAFTVNLSNGNGKLTYPIGLLTYSEARLAGSRNSDGSSTYYLYTGENYWLLTPGGNGGLSTRGSAVGSNGTLFSNVIMTSGYGVRPAISLKYGTEFSGGDGTANSPYIVE